MILELRDIYKTYLQGRLEVPVLRGISLAVENGEYLAIMGPSGSGKTTLMNIIGCLDNPSSGEYILDNEDIGKISERRMSEVRLHSIGFVFQSFYLLSRQSALDNVALPLLYSGMRRRERQEIARKALERVGLGDRTQFKPTQLSGGQCQRVAIARAIVNNPKILLADEPTGALDTRSGQQIMEIFQRLNDEGVTIVMITHEPEIAAHAKRTLHIRDGILVDSQGNPLVEGQSLSDGNPDEPGLPPALPSNEEQDAIPQTAETQPDTSFETVAELVEERPVEVFSAVEISEPEAEAEPIGEIPDMPLSGQDIIATLRQKTEQMNASKIVKQDAHEQNAPEEEPQARGTEQDAPKSRAQRPGQHRSRRKRRSGRGEADVSE